MRRAILILASVIAALIGATQPDVLRIEPNTASSMNLYVEKTGFLSGKKHHFVFKKFDGVIRLDRDAPEKSQVSLKIQAQSIECRDTWVSPKNLTTIQKAAYDDMLAAAKFPYILFESGNIRPLSTDRYAVAGTLTIRDIPKPVTISVTRSSDNEYTGSAQLKLTDYGLKPPSAGLGLVGTKDVMTFTFVLKVAE